MCLFQRVTAGSKNKIRASQPTSPAPNNLAVSRNMAVESGLVELYSLVRPAKPPIKQNQNPSMSTNKHPIRTNVNDYNPFIINLSTYFTMCIFYLKNSLYPNCIIKCIQGHQPHRMSIIQLDHTTRYLQQK